MNERFARKVTSLSFALAIGVILIHTYNLDVYGISDSDRGFAELLWYMETRFNRILNNTCVPFFFFLSGYLFYRNYGWDKVWGKYNSRVKSLLLPYILWCTIYYFAYFALTHIPVISRYMNMEPVSLTVSYYLECLWNSNYTVLWFVKHLLFSVIPTPLFFLFFAKKNTKAGNCLSCLTSFLLIGYAALCGSGLIRSIFSLPFLNVYFLLGGWTSIHIRGFMENADRRKTVLGCTMLASSFIYSFFSDNINILWTLCTIFALWFAADLFLYKKPVPWWMGQSFFLYCAHSILLEGLEKLWLQLAGRSSAAAAADYLLIPIVVVVILCISAVFLNRYCRLLYTVLTGGRAVKLQTVSERGRN